MKLPSPAAMIILFVALMFMQPIRSRAADSIPNAEVAVERFRTACDGEIGKTVSAETMKRIRTMRESLFLMIARKSHVDIAEFIDPQFAAALAKNDLYGSHTALAQSTGDVWVLTYGNMQSLVVYLEAVSGKVLCVAFIPEG